ncbi:hypothetical protein [Niveispirillum sp. BGYR6]|uniref:hypothetical protein n=1 Tax=Niveispirillum sp. BGYR6 TaxID=2971249 RepID=UPI0022B94D56|nr:hypothetical protein [Niveispirillum sp. BGYR6]MDG5497413.1 hypothetical protein [Niveispirillum sp. BGYR6]
MRLMKITTALALVLALTGCFDNQKKDGAAGTEAEAALDPRKEPLYGSLIHLWALAGSAISPMTMFQALVDIDTKAQVAMRDKVITKEELSKINDVIVAGRTFGKAWSTDFNCELYATPDYKFFKRACVRTVFEKLAEIGVSSEKIEALQKIDIDRAEKEGKNPDDFDNSHVVLDDALRASLNVLREKADTAAKGLTH